MKQTTPAKLPAGDSEILLKPCLHSFQDLFETGPLDTGRLIEFMFFQPGQ
jgi:hypothetical protein